MPSIWLFLILTLSFISLSLTVELDQLHQAVDQGIAEVESMIELENRLLANGLTVQRGHPHSLKVAEPNKRPDSALDSVRILAASTGLKNKLNWSADQAREALPLLSLENTVLKDSCPESITCPSSIKYRPIDGSCNNLAHPEWGKVNTPFQRALPNAYADGIFQPREAEDGNQLASGRLITTTFIKPASTEEDHSTLVLMSWGQFITHDLTKAAAFTSADGKTPQCCNATSGRPLDSDYLHPFCLPIEIPKNDTFYSSYNVTCMTFVRTQIGADYSCTLGHAEQLNGNTHWLDGSMIYGSSQSELDNVRLGQDGLLKSTNSSDGYELLPLSPSCSDSTCYYAGDVRAQENPQLAILHTLMMREHNRIARALKKINPKWEDQVLFEETRRIVVAQVQHVTYTEYLPALLGEQAMGDYKLTPAAAGTFTQYNQTTASNPSVWNEFAAAVFRVGHSQVQGNLKLYDSNDQSDKSFTLTDYFFDASQLPQPGFIDSAIRGLTKQKPFSINPEYTGTLLGTMFKGSNDYGFDLVALNIQRGREHGIPDYNTVRDYCGLKKATTFEDLLDDIDEPTIENLKDLYISVNDIDLYIGCLAESSRTVNGSLMGPTSLCIISKQFQVTKNNDRFFYDVGNQGSSLTLAQLDEIRKTSLARILCDNNNGNVTTMQPKAFRSPDAASDNARKPCNAIPSMNLTKWMDPNAQQTAAASQTRIVLSLIVAAMLSLLIFD